jgi:ATP-dependent DNA ligase
VFRHACKLGLEGIVSKRLGSPYRSGIARLAQNEKRGCISGEARRGRGMGQMIRTYSLKRERKK